MNEPLSEAKGSSCARFMIERYLFGGEKYFMTLDNGYTVVPGWDVSIIQDLQKCSLKNPKSILSQIPNSVDKTGKGLKFYPLLIGKVKRDLRPKDEILPTFLYFNGWSSYGIPILGCAHFKNPPVRPFKSLFLSSKFSFAHSDILGELPTDPWYQHLGLDIVDWTRHIRLFTLGWDVYSPTQSIVSRSPKVKEDKLSKRGNQQEKEERDAACQRLWKFLDLVSGSSVQIDDIYDARRETESGDSILTFNGTRRTIDAFKSFTGVDWNRKEVESHALVGMLPVKLCHKRPSGGNRFPFENEEIVAKYGSWTEFNEKTDYEPNKIYDLEFF